MIKGKARKEAAELRKKKETLELKVVAPKVSSAQLEKQYQEMLAKEEKMRAAAVILPEVWDNWPKPDSFERITVTV